MIASLEGKLSVRSPQRAVIDVGGVGYLLEIPLSTYYALPAAGERVRLHTYLHVQDDALRLFGFATLAEREMFLRLISVSRIGPKVAVGILSGIGVAELRAAVLAGDVARLSRIPGVGAKSAERLVVELREKVLTLEGLEAPRESEAEPAAGGLAGELRRDALSALLNLGYRRAEAERALQQAAREGATDLEAVLRGALRRLT
jgi:Holliday junction DNA helicase RuvA